MKKIVLIVLFFVTMTVCVAESQELSPTEGKKTIVLPPEKTDLKPGAGLEKVQIHCLVCHSGDYIRMQPPFTKAQWTAEVTKMIRVFGAGIADDDARIITDYLADNYGTGK